MQRTSFLRNEPSFLSKALVATGAATTFVLAPLVWARSLGFSRNVAYCAAATGATPTPAPPASGNFSLAFLVWLFFFFWWKIPRTDLLIMPLPFLMHPCLDNIHSTPPYSTCKYIVFFSVQIHWFMQYRTDTLLPCLHFWIHQLELLPVARILPSTPKS